VLPLQKLKLEENQTHTIRPSLLSISNNRDGSHNRILASFQSSMDEEGKPGRASHFYLGRRFLLTGLLAIVAVATAGVFLFHALPPSQKAVASTNDSLFSAVKKPTSSEFHESVLEQQSGVKTEQLAAVIITEPKEQGQQGRLLESPSAAARTNLSENHPQVGSMPPDTGDGPMQPNNAFQQKKRQASIQPELRTTAHAATVSNNSSQNRQITKNDRTAVKQANNSSVAKPDRDVSVLAALIAHESESQAGQTGTGNVEQRPVNKSRQSGKTRSTQTSRTARAENEPGRDIVERKPNDSSESLLWRCKQLGFIEGQLCRWRICSGRWDSDDACKASAGKS
jgi:hypothetical protein